MTRGTRSRLTLSWATLNYSTKRDDNNKSTARRPRRNNGDCTCDELIVAGKRQPPPPGHNCEYVRKRKALMKWGTQLQRSPLRKNLQLSDQRAWLETPNEKKVSHRWQERQ